MKYTKHILKNGTRVIITPMVSVQTVTIQVLVEAGSKYETRKNNGISHFLEHMMFKGTEKRPTTKDITEEMDNVGGEYNAFTGKEETGYWIKVPVQHFEKALDVVSDLYLNSKLEQKEINKERGVILQEAAMYRDTPMRHIWDVFEHLLYGDQPAGWNIIGTKENIETLNRKVFKEYIETMYLPKATVISIAGNINEKKTLRLIEEHFKTKPQRKTQKEKKEVIEFQDRPKLKLHYKETDQTHLIVGVRGPNMFNKNRFAAALLGIVLGGGMSSRTFLNIREKHGLTYYINSSVDMMTDTGYLYVSAGVEHGRLEEAIKLILKELKKISKQKVPEKELQKAKEYFKGKTVMSLESTNSVASFFGDQELFRKELSSPQKLLKKIDAVSAEEIQAVAKEIIVNEKLNLAVIGPHKNEKQITKLLRF
ncbi:insulinase family protein [bacterium]|nr:insulinase family protein [bacterium]